MYLRPSIGPNDADGSHFEARGPSFAASSSWCGRRGPGGIVGAHHGSLGRWTNSSRRTRGLREVAADPRNYGVRGTSVLSWTSGPLESFLLNGWPNTIVYALLAVRVGVLCTRVLLSPAAPTLFIRDMWQPVTTFFYYIWSPYNVILLVACSQTLNPATRGDNAS